MSYLKLTTDDAMDARPIPFPADDSRASASRWARVDAPTSRRARHEAEVALDRAERKLRELGAMVEEWEPLPFPRRRGDDGPPSAA